MKRIIALFLALMLALSLCACSQENNSESGNGEGTSSSDVLMRPQRSGIAGLVDRFFNLFR